MMPESHYKPGDVTWLPFGFQSPIVNTSQQKVKFVTLEFP
jgi:hypothetical protein